MLAKEGLLIITTPNTINWYKRIFYLITGKLIGFGIDDNYNRGTNHINPVFPFYIKSFFPQPNYSVKIMAIDAFIPILRLKLPFKGLLWGETAVYVIKKNK